MSGDVLDEVAKYFGETKNLVSTFALASRTLATAVDRCVARRCRDLWSTSTEIEEHGVRLGSGFFARRLRAVRMTDLPNQVRLPHFPDPVRLPLASRQPGLTPEEEAVWSQKWAKSTELFKALRDACLAPTTQKLMDRYLLIDVSVKTCDGVVVGRRSVMLSGELPTDEVPFVEALTIAEDLKPDFFNSNFYNNVQEGIQDGWFMEFGNVVGCRQCVHSGHRVSSIDEIQHDFPDQLMAAGIIDEYRPSQLPSSRRVVSVRVDLFRKDGKSMCLFDDEVGIPMHDLWPCRMEPGFTDAMMKDNNIGVKLLPNGAELDNNLLPPKKWPERYDTLHCIPSVFAKYPEGDRGALELVSVRLEFATGEANAHDSYLSILSLPHMGAKAIHGLLALDAWS